MCPSRTRFAPAKDTRRRSRAPGRTVRRRRTLLEHGLGLIPIMLKDIREAGVSVDLQTYIFKPSKVGRQFRRRDDRGSSSWRPRAAYERCAREPCLGLHAL